MHAQDLIIIPIKLQHSLVIPLGDRFDDDDTLAIKFITSCINFKKLLILYSEITIS